MISALFSAVLDASWRSSVLVAVVLALQWLFRRHLSARFSHALSLALVLRLLLPFALSGLWSPLPSLLPAPVPDPGVAAPFGTAPAPASPSAPVPTATTPAASLSRSAWPLLAALWAAGAMLLLAARLAAAARFARQLRRTAQPAPAAVVQEAQRLFETDRVRVSITGAVATPALCGLVRPHLLLPPALLDRLSPAERQLTIAHEAAHHHRRDLLGQCLAALATAVHWFNPLAWLIASQLRHDCELACDERVLRALDDPASAAYGQTLLRIASLSGTTRPAPLALGVVESKQQLKRRIQMIASPARPSRPRTIFVALAALVCVLATFTRRTVAQTPPPAATDLETSAATALAETDDHLDELFPNGIVAALGEKKITVADIRREIAPLVPQIRKEAKTPEEFRQRISLLENSVIKDLVGRELLIKEWHTPAAGEPQRQVAAEWVDKAIADRIQQQFGGDRAKFLEYLRAQGQTLADYRRLVEEDIIYSYMRAQERKLTGPSPRVSAAADHTGKIHLRLIQLPRNGQTDDALLARGNEVLGRFYQGEKFEDLAQELSVDARRSRGGDWGWLGEKDFKAPFWASVRDLPRGQVTPPQLLPEGAFLLYVEDRG